MGTVTIFVADTSFFRLATVSPHRYRCKKRPSPFEGVTDAALRERMLAAGFDPAVMQGASPSTTIRFGDLFVADSGMAFKKWGVLETRVATITKAMELERAGYRVAFEARFPGSYKGKYRWADILATRGSERRIFEFETKPTDRLVLSRQQRLQQSTGIPVEIVPVVRAGH
ncbi:MAG: hypothetical protein IV086_06335 [Hyphomonadaceae bacterium]|nr:hypothetical protein [Hyphomonadaceae bacterium]